MKIINNSNFIIKNKFFSIVIIFATLFIISCKKSNFIRDIKKDKWKIESVFIRDICGGVVTEITETNIDGYFEFYDYDNKKGEGTGHLDIPVYPNCYSVGYSKTNSSLDFYYSVWYNDMDEKIDIWTDQDDKYGSIEFFSIREYDKKNKLVLSTSNGDDTDYYFIYTEYTLTKVK